MRIAIAGTGNLGIGLWDGLDQTDHEIVALLGDGRLTRAPWKRRLYPLAGRIFGTRNSIVGRAARRGVPVYWLDKMSEDELAPIRALAPDLILVGGFSVILKKPILEIPRIGCVNMHSSLLPRHRGPNPFCAAILAGDSATGITFHVVDEGIDTGLILDQIDFPIGERATSYEIYLQSCDLARNRVASVIDRIAEDGFQGWAQDPTLATYEKKITPNETWINWDRPAIEIDRMVRAMAPNPMPRFMHQGQIVSVARTTPDPTPVSSPPGTVLRNTVPAQIATGEGTLTINVGFISRPFPWVWPAPWLAPKLHERLPKEFRLE